MSKANPGQKIFLTGREGFSPRPVLVPALAKKIPLSFNPFCLPFTYLPISLPLLACHDFPWPSLAFFDPNDPLGMPGHYPVCPGITHICPFGLTLLFLDRFWKFQKFWRRQFFQNSIQRGGPFYAKVKKSNFFCSKSYFFTWIWIINVINFQLRYKTCLTTSF